MPTISNILKKRIEADFLANPISLGEFRPIPKMGGYFVSLESTWEERRPLFFWEINGFVLNIYYIPILETLKTDDQNTKTQAKNSE